MKKSCFPELDKVLIPLLKKGVENGVFSGVAVGVYKSSKGSAEKKIICHGKTKNGPEGKSVKNNTLFDLASLTKPFCTVLGTLHLIETNKISWNTKIESLFGTKTPALLKNIQITFKQDKTIGKVFGECLFTHFGISGPIILTILILKIRNNIMFNIV